MSSSALHSAGNSSDGSGDSIVDADHSVYSDLDQDDLDGARPGIASEQDNSHLSPTITWPPDPQALTRAATALLPTMSSSGRVTLLSDLLLLLSSQELAQISSFVSARLRIDFLSALPIEVSLHVLSFIDDPLTLARASQVSRFWRSLVNDEHTWEAMCLKYRYRYRRPSTVYPTQDHKEAIAGPKVSDADLLASLYRRYRQRGLDPSNARDELRTLHDLFLAKQSAAAAGQSGDSSTTYGTERPVIEDSSLAEMSSADLRFYEQLEQIVQEESRARYGTSSGDGIASAPTDGHDRPMLPEATVGDQPASPSGGSFSGRVGWLSAGPPAAHFPRPTVAAGSRLSPLTGVGANPTFDPSRLRANPAPSAANPSSWTSGLGLPWGLSDLISLPAALGGGNAASASVGARNGSPGAAMQGDISAQVRSPGATTLLVDPPTERRPRRASSDRWQSRAGLGLGQPPTKSNLLASMRGVRSSPATAAGTPMVTPRAATFAGVPRSAPSHSNGNFAAEQFSYKAHFKRNYLTECNWYRGGNLLTHHVSTESGSVCTCLAMDQRWLVVGMANGKIHLFDARTGLFERTLQGRHDSGVWCLALVSRTKGQRKGRKSGAATDHDPEARRKGKGKASADDIAQDQGTSKGKSKADDKVKSHRPTKSPYTSSEAGSDGNQEFLTSKKDLRLVRHDPRLNALVTGSDEAVETSANRASRSRPDTDDQTLMWFHKARHALSQQQSRQSGKVDQVLPASAASVNRSGESLSEAASERHRGDEASETLGGLPRDLVEAGPDFVTQSLLGSGSANSVESPQAQAHLASRVEALRAQITQVRQEHGITGYGGVAQPVAGPSDASEDVEMEVEAESSGRPARSAPLDGNAGSSLDADMDAVADEDDETIMSDEEDEDDYEGFSMGVGGTGHGLGTLCSSTRGFGNEHTLLVSGGCDRELKVWDLETGKLLHKLRGHHSTVRCLRVLEGRPIAISGGRDATVRVWDISTGKEVRVLSGHQNSVRCMEVAGNRVATGSYDCTCRIWDVDTGECLHVLRGHYNQIYCIGFDGNRVATGSLDSTVRVWSAETGEPLALLQGHTALVGQLQLTKNMLISGGSDGRIIAYYLDLDSNHTRSIISDASSRASGRSNAAGATDVPRGRGQASTGSAGAHSTPAARGSFTLLYAICAHDNSVSCLQFDEHFILTGGNDGSVRLWNLYDGSFVRELVKPTAGIWKVAFRDDKVVWVAKQEDDSLSMSVIDFKPTDGVVGLGPGPFESR
ncbi:unnamed protein product [Parajaminaea phylloscopi]